MFDVTKKEISKLRDDDLRELVGLLCEFELKKNNISSRCVTYGGHQDAPDGGVDVRVNSTDDLSQSSYILKKNTIFQVKVPSMSPSTIKLEMKPNGKLREIIKKEISDGGAYIIVSSTSDVSDSQYNKRLKAIRDSLMTESTVDKSQYDFYDSNRIATWVNEHPVAILWVKEKNGSDNFGWYSFDMWSELNSDLNNTFLYDGRSKIYKNRYSIESRLSIIEGIKDIRTKLKEYGKIIRIAGLSGVGKTRFAYSLFDESISEEALDQNKLIYCDLGYNPTPSPDRLISKLINENKEAIIIVDSCPKEEHSQLANIVSRNESTVSLLTIEYDAKEDDLVDTDNYYMESSSDKIIRMYLDNEYPNIHSANKELIVDNSGGNFRMARYFAESISLNKPIGILNNSQLFDRLFMKENLVDKNLLKTAELCSLLFSFNIDSELDILAKLSDLSKIDLKRNIIKLEEMQLIQSRGNMRAVLPHGLANKLSSDMLKILVPMEVINIFNKYDRMFISFTRRLKYLNDVQESQEYALYILNNIPEFSDFKTLDKPKTEILFNVSGLVPELVLERFEIIESRDFFSRKNIYFSEFVNILINIAYDEDLFEFVMPLLFDFALSEDPNENNSSIRNRIYIMYHIYLSGTHSTINQRLNSIQTLLNKRTLISTNLAFKLLSELLQTNNFYGHITERSLGRPDYGYEPSKIYEIKNWYSSIFKFVNILYSKGQYNKYVKDLISSKFRSLVNFGHLIELDELLNEVIRNESWPDLWISIKNLIHFDKDKLSEKTIEKLTYFEELVYPKTNIDRFIVYVKDRRTIYGNTEFNHSDKYKGIDHAYNLGVEFGETLITFMSCLELLKEDNSYRELNFGRGLSSSNLGFINILQLLINKFTKEEILKARIIIKGMFLEASEDLAIVNAGLNMIIKSEKTIELFPYLQGSFNIKSKDLMRIINFIKNGDISVSDLDYFTHCLEELEMEDIINYFRNIPKSNVGIRIIVESSYQLNHSKIFDVRLHGTVAESILQYNFGENLPSNIYIEGFNEVSTIVFSSSNIIAEAEAFFIRIRDHLQTKFLSKSYLRLFIGSLIKVYPEEFLNILLKKNIDNTPYEINHFLRSDLEKGPLEYIDNDLLLKWSLESNKIKEIVKYKILFEKVNKIYAWNNFGNSVIQIALDTSDAELFKLIVSSIFPNSWDRSLSTVLSERIVLIEELTKVEDLEFRSLATQELKKIKRRISKVIENEQKESIDRWNTFE